MRISLPNLSINLPGVTLIELLVVISVIGILVTIGTATYRTAQEKARDSQRKENLENLRDTLILYYQDKNQYPPNLIGDDDLYSDSNAWIPDLVPDYQPELPQDLTQTPGIADCTDAGFYYCYQVRSNNSQFVLWAHLENTKDPELVTNSGAVCNTSTATPPSGSELNFCIKSPSL